MTPRTIEVLPVDHRRAADLTDTIINQDGENVGDLLGELVDAGRDRTLAVTVLLARHLATVMVTSYGIEQSRKLLSCTRWDAAVAEVDGDATDDGP